MRAPRALAAACAALAADVAISASTWAMLVLARSMAAY